MVGQKWKMAVDRTKVRRELREAVVDLQERGVCTAAKWAAEQLVGLKAADGASEEEGTKREGNTDAYLLARTYFDLREYKRAASTLEGEKGAKSTFLRLYSRYLAGERRKEEQMLEDGEACVNEELEGIEREIQGAKDPHLLYLLGLVLLDREKKEEGKATLVESVTRYPCNWAAWQALQEVPQPPTVGLLPDHWMTQFFVAANCLENGDENERGLDQYTELQSVFPNSEYILAQAATAHYNLRQFDEAQNLFELLHRKSPHRIESMDTYSNILYVKEAYAGLSHLAHSAILTDKYKPETCCIIGNYYSLRTQHEKAVAYFRRALKLNRNYLSAWTLMGHEYVEMKNPEAAIEAYRRAVDINPRDYRAWYGLGQTYEVLRMPYYALYYFRQATKLRPGDARFWCAMGQCYESEELNMQDAALQCYKNAESKGDREGIALAKIADLYRKRGDYEAAYLYNKKNIERLDVDGVCNADVVQTLMFLTQHCKGTGRLNESEVYCARLLDYGGNHREDAKSLLKEIRLLKIHSEKEAASEDVDDDDDDGDMSMSD
ncbi:subunit 8 of anaphase-promoting complex [Chloropicon primus]|uniref:Subunit 8 of anaphase-promoting complex n=1 Tax=Chloropicon primus TaxID=1764295 RepID=A0A5B8MUY7_9CHLO|nr:subunit 8 of anaphase-promoting complex [Chloropicon primus]UPR03340.1 subunit 8 of anaphase-promoting complex [Chloropicon primus]|mmetsp:Transcript_299/g.757  ORF Transcript_299/g.757 Transcript_299/m.757 type:complete len:550 (+) Transcript_299:177-1826(+)|eukprot:QDZ24131.1 subunit 8 of anaphase-promoting complex [Chloropicon primus]